MGLLGAQAAGGGDYKALVCLYLNGGNDGNNTLIPLDGAYNDYARRGPCWRCPRKRWHR
ncbi:hypothetical protein ACFQT4_09340 [Pseudoduganella danionis]|uniref:hypothetical protein n=1 Tax=Pseudoduganella danionis TaxID=1890295 RepID=UPI003609CF9D